MEMEDLRSKIIPTTIENSDEFQQMGNNKFNTTDLIWIRDYEEENKIKAKNRRVEGTDYVKMNNAFTVKFKNIYRDADEPIQIRPTKWLRSAFSDKKVDEVDDRGKIYETLPSMRENCCCPAMHYELPSDINSIKPIVKDTKRRFSFFKGKQNKSEEKESRYGIVKVKKRGITKYHTLQVGEWPKTKVDDELSEILESLYNNGKLKEGISCTGRWFSGNGRKPDEDNLYIDREYIRKREGNEDYIGKHSPEFEYQGKRYVRHISLPYDKRVKYSDGSNAGRVGTVRWLTVEPISFIIENWSQLPKFINPKGTGEARYFDLTSEDAIISNIPFYPNCKDPNRVLYQNSCPRGYLNGIDVRNITQNGATEYGAPGGGNFTGECNFLNEAFNLSRLPIIEYTIPDSETEIPDDAFNGCVTLKKIVVHSGIKSIGKRFLDGLDFKYAYRTGNEELIFAQELPQNREEYTEAIELEKLTKPFDEFDCNILLQDSKMDDIDKFSVYLDKNKFKVPYLFGVELAKNGQINSFCDNSDFRFFKNEIPNIDDILSKFSEEEKLNFFKFANSLGCFSTKKILDKNGKETQVIFAQKASSLLAQLLKMKEMQIR